MVTEISRFLAALPVPILALRLLAAGYRLWRTRPVDQLLIVGAGPFARLTQREMRDGRTRRVVVAHLRFDDETADTRLQAPVIGTVDTLETVLQERVVSEVYIATCDDRWHAEVQTVIRSCEKLGVPFALPACRYRLARATPVGKGVADGYVHYLSVQPKRLQWELKRLLDVVASATALAHLAPLLVVTAIAVKLTSRGPVLFRQERVGLHGRTFHML